MRTSEWAAADYLKPHKARLASAFLRGWDDCLMLKKACPYSRRDFADRYNLGWQACNRGEDLPTWAKR